MVEEKISLKELYLTLKKRLSFIIIITAIATALTGIVSYFLLTPIYQSSTQILVNQSKNDQQFYNQGELQTNLQLINTYNVIIKSPAILDKVIEQEKLDMTFNELNEMITVSNEQDSQVVNIDVQNEDPQKAADIANTIAKTFQSEISKIMKIDNVNILTPAEIGEDPSPVKPKPLINMAFGLIFGFALGAGIAWLQNYLDNTIKTEQDIEKHLGLAVLGTITTINLDEENIGQETGKVSMTRTRGESVGS
ncbi:capsular biosynthesis protein [Bacillus sp. UMB0899]|uniref:YveK family protein n=1 Tax=Metabacillus schmidteae TaxID=2730405 RepID=UPI000C807C08|nr:Wzz/FepE/Etk N-terminal domain-containing protein [Metabacillus schmidteae]PMC37367.1 capsular biosynthesis protein [Bacillus sp. UMB0899]